MEMKGRRITKDGNGRTEKNTRNSTKKWGVDEIFEL
jgi:hypothetical protein